MCWSIVAVCTQGCVNGHCIRPDQCLCHAGYSGDNCTARKYNSSSIISPSIECGLFHSSVMNCYIPNIKWAARLSHEKCIGSTLNKKEHRKEFCGVHDSNWICITYCNRNKIILRILWKYRWSGIRVEPLSESYNHYSPDFPASLKSIHQCFRIRRTPNLARWRFVFDKLNNYIEQFVQYIRPFSWICVILAHLDITFTCASSVMMNIHRRK